MPPRFLLFDPSNQRFLSRSIREAIAEDDESSAAPPPPEEKVGAGKKALNTVKDAGGKVIDVGKEVAYKAGEVGGIVYDEGKLLAGQVALKTGVPLYAMYAIFAAIALGIVGGCVFFVLRFFKKKRPKDDKKGEIQPLEDMEELAEAEEKEAPEENEYLGRLKYRLEYDFNAQTFTVTILQAEQLKAMDMGGTSDPYCKVFLIPDAKKKKFETKVHRSNLNPVFNETFVFKNLSFADLMPKTLMLMVYDFDRFGKHDKIGEIHIPLCQIDIEKTIEEWRELKEVEENAALGDICFSLRYAPNTGKLTIAVIECRNLKKMDLGGLSDPYVTIRLTLNGKVTVKKKTTVQKNTLNPYYNQSFTFTDLPAENMHKYGAILVCKDYDRIGTCDPIGKCVVGFGAETVGKKHWTEMLNNPRRPIVQWHTLQDPEDPPEEKDKDKDKDKGKDKDKDKDNKDKDKDKDKEKDKKDKK